MKVFSEYRLIELLHHISPALGKLSSIYSQTGPLFYFDLGFSGNSKYLFIEWLQRARQGEVLEPCAITENMQLAETLKSHGVKVINWNPETLSSEEIKYIALAQALITDQSLIASHNRSLELIQFFSEKPIIQLWHGIGTKKAEAQRLFETRKKLRDVLFDLANLSIDAFLLVPTKKAHILADFLNPRMIINGYPRCDIFSRKLTDWDFIGVDIEAWFQFRERSERSKRSILYAPTWNSENSFYQIEEVLNTLHRYQEGRDINVAVKLHPFTAGQEALRDKYGQFTWIEEKSDVQPFLIHADLLISDHSSIAVDFLYLDRPICWFRKHEIEQRLKEQIEEQVQYGFVASNSDQLLDFLTAGIDDFGEKRKIAKRVYWGRQRPVNQGKNLIKKIQNLCK